jgi:hypothetical protein
MPVYTRTIIKSRLATKVSGIISTTDYDTIINDAVTEVIGDLDMRSTKRKSALSPNMFDDVYDYTCPGDLKANRIIDIRPQIDRGRLDQWILTTEEEFDRLKQDHRVDTWGDPIKLNRNYWLGTNICAIADDDFVRKLKISRVVDDKATTVDPLSAVGTWVVFGDGTNLTRDSDNFVKGSASLNWDISAAGGTTAGIYNSTVTQFDITSYLSGSVFVWAYITSATNLTNYILRIGSSSSAYYSITITTTNEGTAFSEGWNLLRFDFINKVATGTVDEDACDYVAIYMTKAAGKISETDYRFNNLVMAVGQHYDLVYYTKYGWQSSTGTYLENSTADTDYLNVDTDELSIVVAKATELGERHLRSGRETGAITLYENKKAKYQFNNPSEALLLTTTYFFTDNNL